MLTGMLLQSTSVTPQEAKMSFPNLNNDAILVVPCPRGPCPPTDTLLHLSGRLPTLRSMLSGGWLEK
jgi:hypothetical protein